MKPKNSWTTEEVLGLIADFNRQESMDGRGQRYHSSDFYNMESYLEAFGKTLDKTFDINDF